MLPDGDVLFSAFSATSSQASELSRQYEEMHLRARDFDGRLFLDGDQTLLGPTSYP